MRKALRDHPIAARLAAVDRVIEDVVDRHGGGPVADRIMYGASTAADHSLLWHGLGWAEALVSGRPRRALGFSVLIGVESALVNGAIKPLFRRNRPIPPEVRPHRLRRPRSSSFPSGHATSAMVAAAMLTARRPRWWPVFYGLGLTVAVSRVYVRIHHASDVAAGLVVGAGLGRLAVAALRRLPE